MFLSQKVKFVVVLEELSGLKTLSYQCLEYCLLSLGFQKQVLISFDSLC